MPMITSVYARKAMIHSCRILDTGTSKDTRAGCPRYVDGLYEVDGVYEVMKWMDCMKWMEWMEWKEWMECVWLCVVTLRLMLRLPGQAV